VKSSNNVTFYQLYFRGNLPNPLNQKILNAVFCNVTVANKYPEKLLDFMKKIHLDTFNVRVFLLNCATPPGADAGS
jgi:hypothetical protein